MEDATQTLNAIDVGVKLARMYDEKLGETPRHVDHTLGAI